MIFLEKVPGKVRNLRAEVLSSETISVDWDSPLVLDDEGAVALRYKLFYTKANNTNEEEKETQVLVCFLN